ncbi:acyltransferase family protein [Chelatococcus reniformis]|nr:acyltransferase family protein [Chelatococcus reniformis]
MLRRLIVGPTVTAAMAQPHNNFTVIRLALALAVVVSHSFSVVTGVVEDEPLVTSTGFTLGEHAVNGFFVVSGLLVTMSYDRRGWRDYVAARLLRIAPALIAGTLLVALILGAVMTSLSVGAYLGASETWRFIWRTLSSFKSNAALPGVFADNPFRFPMGTVWTLKYEVLCYAGVLALGLTGLLRSRAFAVALVAGLTLAVAGIDLFYPDAPKGLQTSLRLPLLFAAGGAIYRLGERLPLSIAVAAALVLATIALRDTFLYHALLFLTEAYGIVWLALVPVSARLPEPAADLSYGTYLFGWPLQQSLHALLPAWSGLALLAPATAATLLVAALSWYVVEKPALGLKRQLLKLAPAPAAAPAGL